VTDRPEDPRPGWLPGWQPPAGPTEPKAVAVSDPGDAVPPAGPSGPVLAGEVPPPGDPAPKHGSKGRRRRKKDGVRSAVEWVAVIVGALVVALVVKTFLFQAFYIPSGSMEPTLRKGDRVLVNKLSYDLHDVHRGDIVVFKLPPDKVGPDGIKDLIKRVIGLPNEVIESRDGQVYIDGKLLKEPYLPKGVTTNNPPIQKQTVPKDHIFVMGDNRDNSADSRFANRGPIPINTIVGRAFLEVWPPADIGGL
jgi:signal peptidase I